VTTLDTEVLVVGSGAGGAVSAATLAAAGEHVMIVKEGPAVGSDPHPPFSLEEMVGTYRHRGLSAALGSPGRTKPGRAAAPRSAKKRFGHPRDEPAAQRVAGVVASARTVGSTAVSGPGCSAAARSARATTTARPARPPVNNPSSTTPGTGGVQTGSNR